MSDLLSELDRDQRRVVLHDGGPLLVVAGPGSGKTRVMTRRIAYQILNGHRPAQRVLAITFTNRAAQEMKDRIGVLLPNPVPVPIGTFHWMCNRILRRYGRYVGLRRDFQLLSPEAARRVLRSVAESAGFSEWKLADLVSDIGNLKNSAIQPTWQSDVADFSTQQLLLSLYEERLRTMNSVDLDDLQRLAVRLLDEQPAVRRFCQRAYDEILVDEYQDVNPVQQDLLVRLLPVSGSIVAVGDEDQAIYSWRQATSTGMLRFPEIFPDAQVARLERTFRSTKHILRAAATLVSHNSVRIPKNLSTVKPAGDRPIRFVARDETEEASWIASQIAELAANEGLRWNDFCILYRLNLQSRPIEEALLTRGIPHQIRGGLRFYERREVRQVHAFLRLAIDGTDDSAFEYLAQQIPGIGPKRLKALRVLSSDGQLATALLRSSEVSRILPADEFQNVAGLRELTTILVQQRVHSLLSVVDAAIDATIQFRKLCGLEPTDETSDFLAELRAIAQDFAAQKSPLRTFVDRIAFQTGELQASDSVSCMTLHAAKGSEFETVFVAGMEEGLLPHRQSLDDQDKLEEERRLCYVGMTRARTRLYLTYARSREFGGRVHINRTSRFVEECGRHNVAVRVSPIRLRAGITDVQPGDRISHDRWQDGTVMSVDGKGRQAVAVVKFDGAGTKPVPVWYAPIRRANAQQGPHRA